MKLNTAETMTAAWLGLDADYYTPETRRVATEQTMMMADRYKAPHAQRGTPEKPRRRISTILSNRLFKGHRP